MIENHALKLLKCDLVTVVHIVLIHDLFDLHGGQVVTDLGEGLSERHRTQLVGLLSVEFLE